ncbi:MAG TPA: helix-turn-helix transcriptional regulator [Bryobacteraceae bacterium]|jgi:AraC-like DNA-binding protein|nr:helix-turn-helix transcriptional regulator [Bryobacteraceae bacterium]
MAEAGMSRWIPERPNLGSTNTLLVARSRIHSVREFPGPLSIKTVLEGRVAWRIGRREVWIDDSSFLVLNNRELYSMQIDSPEPVATCCVFFEHGFVETIGADLSRPVNARLDQEPSKAPLTFLSCLHPRNPELSASIAALREKGFDGSLAIVLDECFLHVAHQLLLQYKEIDRQMSRIPAVRAATRKELFSRVARGREFLHAEGFGPVRLAQAASAACLSPFHFHRSFLRAFGKTPSRYVTELRLAKAAQLLQRGASVTETCLLVGFESLGSFSASFRKHFGVPPSVFRALI